MKTTLTIKGIHCKSCEILIKDALEDIGVKDATFNKDQLTIDSDISLEKIKKAIRGEGYEVN
jgi:copper chaperone CopZ